MANRSASDTAGAVLGQRELARRAAGAIQLRRTPLRARWELSDLTTADGHRLRCMFSCAVIANDRPADRRMLEEALLSDRDAASADDVARHLEPALRAAASGVSTASNAAALLVDGVASQQLMLDALRSAANAAGFASGIDILPPLQLELHSPTFERERIESMHRRLAERRAAGQVEHVQRATELLQQFQSLRDSVPKLSLGAVLERLSPADRGTTLEALLLASADGSEPPPLWVVAGSTLVRLNWTGASSQPATEVIPLPGAAGPLRSVRSAMVEGARVLLVGARSGVLIVDPQEPAAARVYRAPESGSPLGFNGAIAWDGRLWATHREAGLVAWSIDRPEEPVEIFHDDGPNGSVAMGAAHLELLNGDRIVYSRGCEIRGRTRSGEMTPIVLGSDPIVGIIPRGDGCIVACSSGAVLALTGRDEPPRPPARQCGAVRAAALLPWMGDGRLLLATDNGPVCCVGLDDSLVTQYVSPHRGLKAMAACNGLIAGVSGDRQRIVLWESWDGKQPVAEIHIGALTKHRAADIWFA